MALSCMGKLKKQGILSNISYQKISHALRRCADFREFDVGTAMTEFKPSNFKLWIYQKLRPAMNKWEQFLLEHSTGKWLQTYFVETPDGQNKHSTSWIAVQLLGPLIVIGHTRAIICSPISKEPREGVHNARFYEDDVMEYRLILSYEVRKMCFMILYVLIFFISIGKSVILHPSNKKWRCFMKMKGRIWHFADLICFILAIFYIASKVVVIETCFSSFHDFRGPDINPHVVSEACQDLLCSEYVFVIFGLPRCIYGLYNISILLFGALESSVTSDILSTMQCLYGLVYGLENFENQLAAEANRIPAVEQLIFQFEQKSLKVRSKANYFLVNYMAKYPGVKMRMKTQTVSIMCLKEMNSIVDSLKIDGSIDDEQAQLLYTEIRQRVIEALAQSHAMAELEPRDSLQYTQSYHQDKEFTQKLLLEAVKEFIPPNTQLLTQGKLSKYVYFLLSGSVGLQRNGPDTPYATIYPGQFIGQMSGHFGLSSRATCTTMTRCGVLTMGRGHFNHVVGETNIWTRLLSRHCYSRAIDYFREQRPYRNLNRPQLYDILQTEWQPLTLEPGTATLSSDRFSKVLWIEGRVLDVEAGRELPIHDRSHPFEILARRVRNPDDKQPTIFLVQEKGENLAMSAEYLSGRA